MRIKYFVKCVILRVKYLAVHVIYRIFAIVNHNNAKVNKLFTRKNSKNYSFNSLYMKQFSEVKGFEGLYAVSPDGKIFRLKDGKLGRQIGIPKTENVHNYINTVLYDVNGVKHKVQVHRIIAETFIPNPNKLPYVSHIDGNKHNNSVDNLEWVSYSENSSKCFETRMSVANKVVKGREQFSFMRGWSQVKNFQMPQVKAEILEALNLKTRVSWYQRLYGNIEPRITEVKAIEAVFAKYGIDEVWGVA